MTTAVEHDYARVQIVVIGGGDDNTSLVDVPLADKIPVADCVAQLLRYLITVFKAERKDTSWLEDRDACWHLEEFGEQPLDRDKTLRDQHIYDGDTLYLVKTQPGEKYSPLIDDLPEGITYWLRRNFASWSSTDARRLALAELTTISGVVAAAAVMWCSTTTPDVVARITLTTCLAVPAVIAAALAVVIVRADKTHYRMLVAPLLTTSYLLTGSAALIVTPRPLSVYQLAAAGSILFTLSVCLAMLTQTPAKLHYAVSAGALAVTIVAALNMAYHAQSSVVCMQLIAVCYAIVLLSSRLALAFARISIPHVPATGEPYTTGTDRAGDLDAGNVPRDNTGRADASVLNQERRIVAANDITYGVIAGALTVITAAAFVCGRDLDSGASVSVIFFEANRAWLTFAFVTVIATALLYRGKSDDDAERQTMYLIAVAAILAAFVAGLLTSAHEPDNALRAALLLVALAFGVVVATIYAVRRRRIISPIVLKSFEVAEWILFASILPMLAFAMDLYQKGRSR